MKSTLGYLEKLIQENHKVLESTIGGRKVKLVNVKGKGEERKLIKREGCENNKRDSGNYKSTESNI